MVQEVLRREKMANLRYDGSMNRALRDRFVVLRQLTLLKSHTSLCSTIQNFKSRAGPNILIISLKCGGVGYDTFSTALNTADMVWLQSQLDRSEPCHLVRPYSIVVARLGL